MKGVPVNEVASDMGVSDRGCGVTALECVSMCCAHCVRNATASLCMTCLTVISASISAACNKISLCMLDVNSVHTRSNSWYSSKHFKRLCHTSVLVL